MKKIGIYLITSPTGKKYVGQSIDIENRWKEYSRIKNCDGQTKLKNSLSKYGPDKHLFVILELCERELLNEKEIHWGLIHDVLSQQNGLNLKIGNQSEGISDELKALWSKQRKGKSKSQEWKDKIGAANKISLKGNIPSQETRNKISAANLGKVRPKSEVHRKSISQTLTGRVHSEETKKRRADSVRESWRLRKLNNILC